MITSTALEEELERLGGFYDCPERPFRRLMAILSPWLDRYAEIVLDEDGFEVITGAVDAPPEELARLAVCYGGGQGSASDFRTAAEEFPDRMLGLKVRVGRTIGQPTLYCRTMASKSRVLAFLAQRGYIGHGLQRLSERLASTEVMYGLGFFSRNGMAGVKTYTVANLDPSRFIIDARWARLARTGFVSYRLLGSHLSEETKIYFPDLAWESVPALSRRWQRLLRFASEELGYHQAGHLGLTLRPDRRPRMKLYVERQGAIPNDFTAR